MIQPGNVLVALGILTTLACTYLIIKKIKRLMTVDEQVKAILGRVETATNNIAANNRKLLEQAKAGSIQQETLVQFEKDTEALESLGTPADTTLTEGVVAG